MEQKKRGENLFRCGTQIGTDICTLFVLYFQIIDDTRIRIKNCEENQFILRAGKVNNGTELISFYLFFFLHNFGWNWKSCAEKLKKSPDKRMQKSKRFTAHSVQKKKYYPIYIAKNMTIIRHSCIFSIEIQKVFNSLRRKKKNTFCSCFRYCWAN